jgi:hypothetical protein
VLRTPVPCRGEDLTTVGEFTVDEGDIVPFTWTYAPSHLPPPEPVDPRAALEATEPFWSEWSARARLEVGVWRGAVMRSLITPKGAHKCALGRDRRRANNEPARDPWWHPNPRPAAERFPWPAGGRRRDPLGIKMHGTRH